MLARISNDFRLAAAQKRISGFFQRNGRRQGGRVLPAQVLNRLFALDQSLVAGLDHPGKADIIERVFMAAVDEGCAGQVGELFEGLNHLLRRTLKQSTTAATEKGVTTK